MIALEVTVNGQRRYVVGHLDAKVLNVIVSGYTGPIGDVPIPVSLGIRSYLAVPNGSDGQMTTLSYPWAGLSVGDEVVIRIVDTASADMPMKQNSTLGSIEIVVDGDVPSPRPTRPK